MRMDDITVMVVDVNPNNFICVNGKSGGGGLGSGEGDKKCVVC